MNSNINFPLTLSDVDTMATGIMLRRLASSLSRLSFNKICSPQTDHHLCNFCTVTCRRLTFSKRLLAVPSDDILVHERQEDHENTDQKISEYETISQETTDKKVSASVKRKPVRKRKILHNRQINFTQQVIMKETWDDFAKDLSEQDTFGSLNPDAVSEFMAQPDTSKKSTAHTGKVKPAKDKKKTKKPKERSSNTEKVEPSVNYSALKKDPEWTSEFGTLVGEVPEFKEISIEDKKFEDDEGEIDEFREAPRKLAPRRRRTPNWYGKQIEILSKEGKIYECIEVLETQMLKEDRVRPNQYVFTVLIGALGRVGYTEKAFSLFESMQQEFKLEPENPTYTALFNACSNSPSKDDGLERANKLREWMHEKGIHPNLTTYKAMIKAFGRCGDLQTAFLLADELNAVRLRADEEVFAMLLQACLSNKETGLRYAVEVWRRLMKRRKVWPTIYHYNLLIRIIKDCEIGDPIVAKQVLLDRPQDTTVQITSGEAQNSDMDSLTPITTHNKATLRIQQQVEYEVDDVPDEYIAEAPIEPPSVTPETDGIFSKIAPEKSSWWAYKPDESTALVESVEQTDELQPALSMSILDSAVPDILGYKEDFSSIVNLGNLDTKHNRLALFGGLPGILSHMKNNRVKPDIRTFTQLLDLIPSNRESERDLLAAIKVNEVKLDVDILNLMIRKRNLRKDYKGAKAILSLIAQNSLTPNIMTYGCLAMGCRKKEEGLQLITDMENANCVPSVDICNVLMYQSWMDFTYKLALCQNMARLQIRPNKAILERIESAIKRARTTIVRKEKGEDVPFYARSDKFDKDFVRFLKYYKPWLISMKLDAEPGVWDQFQKPTPSNDDDINTKTV